jgi:hypothetical protein
MTNDFHVSTRIPKVLWYMVAYAIFVMSTGVAVVIVRSTATSLEVGGLKMELQQTLSREKELLSTVEQARPAEPRLHSWKSAHAMQVQQLVPAVPPAAEK